MTQFWRKTLNNYTKFDVTWFFSSVSSFGLNLRIWILIKRVWFSVFSLHANGTVKWKNHEFTLKQIGFRKKIKSEAMRFLDQLFIDWSYLRLRTLITFTCTTFFRQKNTEYFDKISKMHKGRLREKPKKKPVLNTIFATIRQ